MFVFMRDNKIINRPLIKKALWLFAIIFLVLFVFVIFVFSKNEKILHQRSSLKDTLDLTFTTLNPFPKKEKIKSIYLVAGGDIMLSRNIGRLGKSEGYDRIFGPGKYNPVNDFENCNYDDCVLLFNLESLFYTPDNDVKEAGFTFRANTGNIKTLQQLKDNKDLILSLTNNHTINGGFKGINMTKELLDANGIYHVGAGLDLEESRKIGVLTKNDIKVCYQAYSYDGQYVKVGEGKISWNKIDEKNILEDLQSMKFLDCDVKIIILHWGAEYYIKPNTSQRNLAKTLIQGGADLILGGHSHVPGVFTKIDDKFVFYSFGNFIFDQNWGKSTKIGNADYIYDYNLKRHTVPTYISLLGGFKIIKNSSGVVIKLDKIVMSEVENGLHSPLDKETYQGIYDRIEEL
ncbi:MAG: CapA family protein [Candidatus Absconditabacterales bacterium]|nr:CapA family protein [Candidatus Absconditabacterales bacterium]